MQATSSILAGVTTLAAMLAGISVAVERAVQVIKDAVPPLAKPWAKNDGFRAAILEVIAAVAGTIVASQLPAQVRASLPFGLGADLNWAGYVIIGLAASGGSGAWNHVLDILAALKSKQQTAARLLAAGTQPAPQQPPQPAPAAAKAGGV